VTYERRSLLEPLEFRSAAEGRKLQAVGYAYKFNMRSLDLGGFTEVVAPGAGAESMASDDIVAVVDHDTRNLIGRTRSGTLRVGEDNVGGWYEVDLPDTSTGRDLAALLERGDITGSSFRFRVLPGGDEWAYDTDDRPLRTLLRFTLGDVGPVTFPAYEASEAALRSLEALRSTRSELTEERFHPSRPDRARRLVSYFPPGH
jgi:HK97 family phage prohead protease